MTHKNISKNRPKYALSKHKFLNGYWEHHLGFKGKYVHNEETDIKSQQKKGN